MAKIQLRLGRHLIGVACDSRKTVKLLEAALGEHIIPGNADDQVSFLLNRPRALERAHILSDRTGFVLSKNRGLESGVAALGSHLAAFLPPQEGCVRIRARALVTGDAASLCLAPLLLLPRPTEKELSQVGVVLMDRLAVDIDIRDGSIRQAPMQWAELDAMETGLNHASGAGQLPVRSIFVLNPPGSPPPTRSGLVATLASVATDGSPQDVLDACVSLVERADAEAIRPGADTLEILETIATGLSL